MSLKAAMKALMSVLQALYVQGCMSCKYCHLSSPGCLAHRLLTVPGYPVGALQTFLCVSALDDGNTGLVTGPRARHKGTL